MNLRCPCGSSLGDQATANPRPVQCSECGKRFTVSFDGTLRNVADEVTEIASGVAAPVSLSSIDTSIAAGVPDDIVALHAEWMEARTRHSLVALPGIRLLPSRMLAIAIGMLLVSGAGFLLEMGLWSHEPHWYVLSAAIAVLALVSMVRIISKTNKLEGAESRWLAKRRETLDFWVIPSMEPTTERPAWHKKALIFGFVAVLALGVGTYGFRIDNLLSMRATGSCR